MLPLRRRRLLAPAPPLPRPLQLVAAATAAAARPTAAAAAPATAARATTATAAAARPTAAAATAARPTAAAATAARPTAAAATAARPTAAAATAARPTAAAATARPTAAAAAAARPTAATAARPTAATAAAARPTAQPAAPQPAGPNIDPNAPIPSTTRSTFARFDRDNSGTLELGELGAALRHLGLDASTDETIAIMHKYDASQDGKLDIVEFNGLVIELSQFLQEQPPPTASAAARARSGYAPSAPTGAAGGDGKRGGKDMVKNELKEADISGVFLQFRVGIGELFEFYAVQEGGGKGAFPAEQG